MKLKTRTLKEYAWGYALVLPLILGIVLFLLYPLVSAIVYSFTDYDLFHVPNFVGLDNYVKVFHDRVFWRSFGNIFLYSLCVPVSIFVALLLSVVLNQNLKGMSVYRVFYFIPMVCGSVAIMFIWKWMYAPYYGLLDNFLTKLGIDPPLFLDKDNFIGSMILIALWGGLGGRILLFTPTLRNISTSLYEAAKLDGAGWWQIFFHITFPAISPITFYLFITGMTGVLQEFTNFYVISGGVFSSTTIVPVWYIYLYTGEYGYQFGYASALGMIYGFVLILFVVINFIAQKWWVKYD